MVCPVAIYFEVFFHTHLNKIGNPPPLKLIRVHQTDLACLMFAAMYGNGAQALYLAAINPYEGVRIYATTHIATDIALQLETQTQHLLQQAISAFELFH
jgi:hypothetical protein